MVAQIPCVFSPLILLQQQCPTEHLLLFNVSHNYYSSNQFHWHQAQYASCPLGLVFCSFSSLIFSPHPFLVPPHLTAIMYILLAHVLLSLTLSCFFCSLICVQILSSTLLLSLSPSLFCYTPFSHFGPIVCKWVTRWDWGIVVASVPAMSVILTVCVWEKSRSVLSVQMVKTTSG